jgi:hypothetical protein
MDWLESGVFCGIRADGCVRNTGIFVNGVFYAVRVEMLGQLE